ncbi:MAG: Hsp20/alpha crystallin family protein [Bacteroidales bacterium]|nr:Hsp20/alpha crystallin family protein [Bacteroidales bacterium]
MSLIRKYENFPAWSNFFNDFFNRDLLDWTTRNFSDTNTTLPSVNIKEGEENYEVEMAAPGLQKKDFKIELANDVLTISSEKKVENETKKGQQFTRREFSYQSFNRSFTLPHTVDGEKISASYENGILRVLIPKKEEARPKPARTIEIK